MSLIIGVLTIFSGYLLGSIPSAYIIGCLKGRDLTEENGDSKIGTTYAFRMLGIVPGIIVAIMDFGKGFMTIVLGQMLDAPVIFILLAGFMAVVGHNWSIFLGFKGGRGAMASYGVLASLVIQELVIAMAFAGIFYFFTRKSTLSTAVLMAILATILWIQSSAHFPPLLPRDPGITLWLAILPLTLLIPNVLKYIQIRDNPVKRKSI